MSYLTPPAVQRAFARYTDASLMRQLLDEPVNALWGARLRILDCELAHSWQKTYAKSSSHRNSRLSLCYRLQLHSDDTDTTFVSWIKGEVRLPNRDEGDGAVEPSAVRVNTPDSIAVFRRFDNDPALPQLASLIDPITASVCLHRAQGITGERQALSMPEVVQYRPGTRCSLRYDIARDGSAARRSVFAKTYSDDTGERAYGSLRELRAQRVNTSIPGTLGYDRDTRTLWHTFVDGASAAQAFDSATRMVDGTTAVGRALAALHESRLDSCDTVTREQLLRDTFKRVAKLSVAYPALAHGLQDAFDRCADAAALLPFAPPVPIHGDAHIAQFLICGDHAVMVDFDELGNGEAEQDLAGVIVDLRLRSLRSNINPAWTATLINAYAGAAIRPIHIARLHWHLSLQSINKAYRLYWRALPQLVSFIAPLAQWARVYAGSLSTPECLPC